MSRQLYTPAQAEALRADARRLGLEAHTSFWTASAEQLAAVLNGMGPDWFPAWLREKLIANQGRFAAAVAIHDWAYYLSLGIADEFHAANWQFLRNCRRTVRKTIPVYRWQKRAQMMIDADLLYGAVCAGGWPGYAAGAHKADLEPGPEAMA